MHGRPTMYIDHRLFEHLFFLNYIDYLLYSYMQIPFSLNNYAYMRSLLVYFEAFPSSNELCSQVPLNVKICISFYEAKVINIRVDIFYP